PRQAFQRQKQRVRAKARVALRGDGQVQLFGLGQARDRQVHASGYLQRDAHVLEEVLDVEARIEVALHHARAEVVDRPRLGRAAAHGFDYTHGIEPGLARVEQALADADHRRGDEDLVDHLGVLARAGRAEVGDALAEASEDGPDLFERALVAADHDGQR